MLLHFLPQRIWNLWCNVENINHPYQYENKSDQDKYRSQLQYGLNIKEASLVFDCLISKSELDEDYIKKWINCGTHIQKEIKLQ